MKKEVIIGITTSIAVSVSVTLLVVNVEEISFFKQEITNNVINSRGDGNRQKDRNKYNETDRNRKPKTQADEVIKTEQDTTQDTIENEVDVFAEEEI